MNNDEELVRGLEELSWFEQKHNLGYLIGYIRKGSRVTIEESIEHLLKVLPRSVSLLNMQKNLFNPGYCPPN